MSCTGRMRRSRRARSSSLRARPDPRHALRGADAPAGASGCTVQAVEALEASTATSPAPHLAELAHHSSRRERLRQGLHYARRAGDRALDAARVRGGRTSVRAGDRRPRPLAVAATRRAGASCCSRSATRRPARGTGRRRRTASSKPPRSRDVSGCRESSREPRRATADALSGRVPVMTNSSSRCSRRRWTVLGEADVKLRGRGSSPDSPGRCATSTHGPSRRAEPRGGRGSRAPGDLAALVYALDGRTTPSSRPTRTPNSSSSRRRWRRGRSGSATTSVSSTASAPAHRAYVLLGEMHEIERVLEAIEPIAVELRQPA